MKFTKTIWLVIGAGIFIVALAALGMVIFQQVDEKSQLNKQLASSQSQLQSIQREPLSSQQAELEGQLNQAIPKFEALKTKLSQPVSNTVAALFDAAKTRGLVVTDMTSSSPTNESVPGATLLAMPVSVKVEGSVYQMVNYIAALNNLLKTSAIESVEITVPEQTSGDNASATSAIIQLAIYTYRGD